MPWMETDPVNQRRRFVRDLQRGHWNMTELCARYGVSRDKGYKWLNRFELHGLDGLKDRSRKPKTCPHQTSEEVRELLIEAKMAHPTWGPKKILPWLQKQYPRLDLPAPSTVSAFFSKKGLVRRQPRRRRHSHPGATSINAKRPNDLWTADFKGQFRMRNGEWCYPLTIADQRSRYLLACEGKPSIKQVGVFPVFKRLFKDRGMPKAIRTDNGPPFCSTTGIHGLSNLNAWWMKLGIEHSRMDPASPQQNGAHERMHRTLKAEATKPPKANMKAQQRCFNEWRNEYNEERPHEFLDDDTPASHYRDSWREYPSKLPEPHYPRHLVTPLVNKCGTYRFKTELLFVSNTLAGCRIGLEEVDDGIWNVFFYKVLLARLDERDWKLYT